MEFLVATGIGTGSQPEIFMVINYLNDVPLQFGADGNQITAVVPGVNLPAYGNGLGSITWNGDSYGDVWAGGIVYSIFDNLDSALQNYTTGSGAKVTGQLGGSSGTNTAGNLPSGWLAVYCPGNQQLYVLTQYFSEFAAIMTPFYGQAVFYIQ